MTATNLLTNHTQAGPGDSGLWSDSGGGPGSGQDANAPIEVENRSRRVSGSDRGFSIGKGTINLSPAGIHVGIWVRVFQPGSTNFIRLKLGGAAGGPDTNPRNEYNFAGSLYPFKGPWIRLWLDPARTPDLAGGTLNLAAINWVGANFDMGTVSGTSPNVHIARVDYGTRGIDITGAGGTFAQAEAIDSANRLEIIGEGILNGPIRLKNGTFSDTNVNLKAGQQPLAASDWIRIEIDNTDAGNSVTFGNVSLDGILVTITGTVGVIDLGVGTFQSAPAMIWNSSVVFAGSLVTSGPLNANGANLAGAKFSGATGAHAVAVDSFAQIDGATFTRGASGHAVDRGTISASVSETWNCVTTGYDAGVTGIPVTTTSTGNETIRVNVAAGQTYTINVADGATVPSVRNDGPGAVNIVAGQKTITFINLAAGGEFRIYDEDGDGNSITLGTNREGTESLSGTTYVMTHSSGEAGNVIYAQFIDPLNFEEQVISVTLSANDQTVPFDLQPEENI